jgi:L-threonylcarbamoyladenylate synthase
MMRISMEQAAGMLKAGSVVAVPTETVYGLGASLDCPSAIKQIFILKGRPSSNPLIVHLPDAEAVLNFVNHIPDGFTALAKAFWPGPMTLVLQADIEKVPEIVRAGLPTAAFRVPQHPIARRLLQLSGPLVMPSANLSGTPSATHAEHVETDFGPDFPVLEGVGCSVGVESTILIFIEGQWQIIRQGALSSADFERVLGYAPVLRGVESDGAPLCPGQLFRHYAPNARLVLSKECGSAKEGVVVGYTDRAYSIECTVLSLGNSTKPNEIAENLYATLRSLDALGVATALVDVDLPSVGLYATILERLHKASEKKTSVVHSLKKRKGII